MSSLQERIDEIKKDLEEHSSNSLKDRIYREIRLPLLNSLMQGQVLIEMKRGK